MIPVDPKTLTLMKLDLDHREETIRRYVYEALESLAPAELTDTIVAAFFVAARSMTVQAVGGEISYHMTSGVRSASPGSLLDQCTGKVVDCVHFEPNGRTGLVRVAFPLKMLLHEDGSLYTTDLLHILAGEGTFGLTEHADIKLVWVDMSDESLRRFPGPAHGAPGVRKLTGLADDEIAFGTILKPCTGITPAEESAILSQAAANPMFIFVKEDENFLPGVAFAPLRERLRHAQQAIQRAKERRGGKGLIFAPHLGAPPQHLPALVDLAADAGMTGIMFSEYYTGGAVRMAREQLRRRPSPPVIYGHNGGISCRTRHIYREVLDYFARLDGVDFRQTAPLSCTGESLLRPVGLESAQMRRRPLPSRRRSSRGHDGPGRRAGPGQHYPEPHGRLATRFRRQLLVPGRLGHQRHKKPGGRIRPRHRGVGYGTGAAHF